MITEDEDGVAGKLEAIAALHRHREALLSDMTSLRPGTPAAPRFYPCGVEFSEVIKHRKMVRAFTPEPLAPGVTDRLLRAANRAPSAGFSQGYSFLVLEGSDDRPVVGGP